MGPQLASQSCVKQVFACLLVPGQQGWQSGGWNQGGGYGGGGGGGGGPAAMSRYSGGGGGGGGGGASRYNDPWGLVDNGSQDGGAGGWGYSDRNNYGGGMNVLPYLLGTYSCLCKWCFVLVFRNTQKKKK